jgi:signal transduction histidine kinase
MGAVALAVLLATGLAACTNSTTSERGSADEAVDLVESAIETYDANGAAAFVDMTAPSTTFVDRDLYIFVFDPNHLLVAHGANAELLGDDATILVDANGVPFGNTMIVTADEDGEWVDYMWMDPLTGTEVAKSSYVVLHDGYIFGSGIYLPE